MGICASCLGLNRHPSQDGETDPLLDDQAQYGGTATGDAVQPDEEELGREREALEQITADATENMIDVLHPGDSERSIYFGLAEPGRLPQENGDVQGVASQLSTADGREEQAWLRSIEELGGGVEDMNVRGLHGGPLIKDMAELKEAAQQPSAAKRSLKARLM